MNTPPLVGRAASEEVLRRLELTITRRLDGMLQGDYRGLVPGHGSEPGDTRLYQPGDDVRRIDWNVTARTIEPHVRETIADRELESWVVVDRSPSLDFGTANCEKRDLAVAAVAAIGFLTARTGNRFGVLSAGGAALRTQPARPGRAHLMGVLHELVDEPRADVGTGQTDLAGALRRASGLARRRGLVVVISDFLAPEGWVQPLRLLRARHEVLAIEIIDPRELELPAVGVLDLVDPETGERRELKTSEKLRTRYAEAARQQREKIARDIRSAGADHLVLRTDRDWLLDMVKFVTLRRLRAERPVT